jgi:hypothetical protein
LNPLAPVRYNLFIEALYWMGACIPVLPSDEGRSFMVFNNAGSGYIETPSGPRCPLMSRAPDELVPGFEQKKTLGLLQFDVSIYLGHLAGCEMRAKAQETQAIPKNN